MEKIVISTPNAPAAIGPYAQGIRLGDVVYTSGQLPIDPKTGELVSDDIKKYLIDNYGIKPGNIRVTINGIDTQKFSKNTDISRSAKSQLNKSLKMCKDIYEALKS